MSYTKRAYLLMQEGLSEAEAYAVVADERRAAETSEASEAKALFPSVEYVTSYREAQEEGEEAA